MNASRYIGRVGALAAALGVGAAVFTGAGVAAAAPSTGSTDSSANKSTTDGTSGSTADTGSDSGTTATTKPVKTVKTGPLAGLFHHTADTTASSDDTTDTGGTAATSQTKKNKSLKAARAAAKAKASTTTGSSSTTDTSKDVASTSTSGTSTVTTTTTPTDADTTPTAQATVDTPSTLTTSTSSSKKLAAAASTTTTTATTTAATTTTTLATVLTNLVDKLFSGSSDTTDTDTTAETPLAWLVAAFSRRETTAAATTAAVAAAATTTPTLVLNGYNVVATSPENVTSFYGMFNMIPGSVGVVQGTQSFDLVDPTTGDTVGSFDALVAKNNSLGFGQSSVQLVVTSVSGTTNIGAGAGQVPPVGSVIARYGNGTFDTIYTAMPSTTGGADVVSYKAVNPFGTFKLFTTYDAAKGLTDYSEVNAPIELPNGGSIIPVSPSSEVFTGIAGSPPIFTSLQGTQQFKVLDANGNVVGTFTGVVTTTSDAVDTYSEAVLVTSTDSGTVGTDDGQVPPIGTVYNVIYFGSTDKRLYYSAKPTDSGPSVITTQYIQKNRVTDLSFIKFDAATAPDRPSLTVPGAYTLTSISDFEPISGVNGLPPREVEVQGYQQFSITNKAGEVVGTVDAQVIKQWDLSGSSKESILVTNVISGTPGTGTDDVPPVGSVFNFKYTGSGDNGQAYYALPSPTGDVISYKSVTIFGAFPLFTTYDAAAGLGNGDDYTFYNPYNMLAV